jgi:hypothetical protein
MKAPIPALVSLAAGLLAVTACGGKLEEPERFRDLLSSVDGGGGKPSEDAAVPPGKDAGGGGTGGGGDDTAPPACVTMTFKAKCGTAGCHDSKMLTGIDLVAPGVTERLVDQDSNSAGVCKDRVYISTGGDPSLLLQKLTTTPPCGSPMPLVGTLSASEKKCITDWVTSLGGTAGGT